jgi:hypothetical protein
VSCAATQDVTERIVQEEKRISPKSTMNARSVKTDPVDSSLLDGAPLAAAFASEAREGGSRRKSLDNSEQYGFEFGAWSTERLSSWKTSYLEFMGLLDLLFTTRVILYLTL